MRKLWLVLLIPAILISCSDGNEPRPINNGTGGGPTSGGGSNSSDWLIPQSQVFDGGPGKDGIPSVDNPQFGSIDETRNDLADNEFVVVVQSGGEVRAYPHNILDWHEIVNDALPGDLNIALTYCPLTGTAIGWDRVRPSDGRLTTFGVSGLLYNTNLMPYDRISGSYWSQMLNLSVNGERIGEEVKRYQVVEMNWEAYKANFPQGRVMTRNTGINRPYGSYPYGNYLTEDRFLFPVESNDNRLFSKERVHGVQIGGITRVYRFESFMDNPVITDQIAGQNIVLFGDIGGSFIVSFNEKAINDEILVFQSVENGTNGVIFSDQLGNQWNMFGEALSGPNVGEKLEPTPSYIGFFFSWGAFNDNVEIFGAG